jgi:hypothetical protein
MDDLAGLFSFAAAADGPVRQLRQEAEQRG